MGVEPTLNPIDVLRTSLREEADLLKIAGAFQGRPNRNPKPETLNPKP